MAYRNVNKCPQAEVLITYIQTVMVVRWNKSAGAELYQAFPPLLLSYSTSRYWYRPIC